MNHVTNIPFFGEFNTILLVIAVAISFYLFKMKFMTKAKNLAELSKNQDCFMFIKDKIKVSHDSWKFVCGFEPEDMMLGVLPGRHV